MLGRRTVERSPLVADMSNEGWIVERWHTGYEPSMGLAAVVSCIECIDAIEMRIDLTFAMISLLLVVCVGRRTCLKVKLPVFGIARLALNLATAWVM